MDELTIRKTGTAGLEKCFDKQEKGPIICVHPLKTAQ